jgi:hypothetical protein
MIKAICNILLCSLCVFFCVCKTVWINTSKENDSVGATSVGQLQITPTDVSGWTQSDFNTYPGATLRGPLDGGADLYMAGGGGPGEGQMIDAAIQDMTGPSGKSLTAYCMDYGNEISAIGMQQVLVNSFSNLVNIPYFSDTLAVGVPATSPGAITIYAHFNKFFIQLAITGCQNQTEALQTASLFLQIYQSKID